MTTHAIITRWDIDGRVNKAIDKLTLAEANAQLPAVQSGFNAQAFIVAHAGDLQQRDYIADPVAKTITLNPLPIPKEQLNAPILAQIERKDRQMIRSVTEMQRAREIGDVPADVVTAAKTRFTTLYDEREALRRTLQP